MLVGLAVGDAVGTTVEFADRGTFEPVTDMVGAGPFDLAAGQWTDDTSMALCLGASLLSKDGWDASDCMRRFVNWREAGYMSSTGACFDIGLQTSTALDRFLATGNPMAGPTSDSQSGNGGIMRLAPAVISYGANAEAAQMVAALQSSTTHASPTCLSAARDMAEILLDPTAIPVRDTPPPVASGYVVHTLDAVFWALNGASGFQEAVLKVVNLGGDSDTTGAVLGQIAGRIWGYEGIPGHWRARLHDHDAIVDMADALYALLPSRNLG